MYIKLLKLVVLLIVISQPLVFSEDENLSMTIGSNTSIGTVALRIIAEYEENLNNEILKFGADRLFYLSPDIRVSYSDNSEQNTIVAKAVGYFLFFDTITPPGGIETIDVNKVVQSVPFSLGLETDGQFEQPAFLVETGYVPWYRGVVPPILKRSKIGIFLQGGYKTELSDTNDTEPLYESSEAVDDAIFRAKAMYNIEIDPIFLKDKIGLVNGGSIWYDIYNSDLYYQLSATLKIFLNSEKNKSIDLNYEKGSGPPYFNTNDSFSTNLKVAF